MSNPLASAVEALEAAKAFAQNEVALYISVGKPSVANSLEHVAAKIDTALSALKGAGDDPCLQKKRVDEPSFTLLGRDPQAPELVEIWAADRRFAEGPSQKVDEARRIAANMREFKSANPELGMSRGLLRPGFSLPREPEAGIPAGWAKIAADIAWHAVHEAASLHFAGSVADEIADAGYEALWMAAALPPPPAQQGGMSALFGTKIIVSSYAVEDTDERLFPYSKHRSARIRKKLVKRHGGEFRKRPCAWKLADGTLVLHPVLKAKLDAHLSSETPNAG